MRLSRLTTLAVLLSITLHTGCVEQSSTKIQSSEDPEETFTGTIAVGDTVPDLRIPKLLQAQDRDSITLGELKGSTVVLEFWATWCGPCRDVIPHMNELVDTFAGDENIRFISISDEPERKVTNFMKRHSMHAWVGIDESAKLHQAFEVNAIPRAIIINSEGKVVQILHPVELDAQLLRDILGSR